MLIKASLARLCQQPIDGAQGLMSRGNWLRHPGPERKDITGATLIAKQGMP
jgi:hypothetical protein